MRYNPEKHHRRSIRMKGYDYAQGGAYFVTVVTQDRECLLGNIVNGEIRLNDAGRIVEQCWLDIPSHFPRVELDAWVVMPNHMHGIIVINGSVVGATHASPLPSPIPPTGPKPQSVGAIIGSFKSAVTKRINTVRGTPGMPVWQRNYYEQIIRDEESMNSIRQYVLDNPIRWEMDQENPDAIVGATPRACPTPVQPVGTWEHGAGQPVESGQPQGIAPTALSLGQMRGIV